MVRRYNPQQTETKWQKRWEEAKLSQAIDFDKRQKRYILIEFPYPSGERLHVGHGKSYTALDALSRKLRMEGYNVLYPMGWDAFGLPAENYALKTGINPQVTTAQNIANAKVQAQRWGLSFDWSREINTTDPKYYKWTQWIFLKMFEKGLAYKAEVPVSWCPSCKINLANEEVVAGKCERCGTATERRMQSQWMLKITLYAQRLLEDLKTVNYLPKIQIQQENWIGRSEGTEIKFKVQSLKLKVDEEITVFTTRADTLFGVTALVLAPEHPLVAELLKLKIKSQKSKLEEIGNYIEQSKRKSELERTELVKEKTGVFTGFYCINPINNESVPIWVGDYVIGWYGGGAVMVVPAHDQRDFEFAQKYGLEIREVIVPKLEVRGGKLDKEMGSAKKSHLPSQSEASPASHIQPLTSAYEEEGILVNSGKFGGQKSAEARANITKWLKQHQLGKATVTYKLRDWVFSRQHYWGEPIPIIYCRKCWELKSQKSKVKSLEGKDSIKIEGREHAIISVPEENLPVELPYVENYQPTGTGESPLATVTDWVNVVCPECDGAARRETDTMPNWAGSNWYFLRYCDPQNEKVLADRKKLDYWLPVDLYNGGMEHTTLHLLYSRFVYKFLSDIGVVPGVEPYARRHSHGVVLGPDRQKMSKSLGNVINPDDIVSAYGADTFRLYEMFMGPFEQMIGWSNEGAEGCFRFLKRVWQLSLQNVKDEPTPEDLLGHLHRLIKKVSEDLENLRFNTAIAAMMEFTNHWSRSDKSLNLQEAKIFLQLLAPFSPYITEELWGFLGGKFSIHQSAWPKYDPKLIQEEIVTVVVQVNGKLRAKLEVQSPKSKVQSEIAALARQNDKVNKYLAGKKIKKVIFVPGKLINFVI